MKYVVAILMILCATKLFAQTILTDSVMVAQSSDDARRTGATGFDLTSTVHYLGKTGAGANLNGFRFQNCQTPKNATIDTAYIRGYVYSTANESTFTVNVSIYGEAADSASTYTDYTNFDARSLTTAKVSWNNLPYWGHNVRSKWGVDSGCTPDLKSIVSEITSRSGWAVGNAMAFQINDSSSSTSPSDARRIWRSYDNSAANAPMLIIRYHTGGGGSPTTPTTKVHEPGGIFQVHSPSSTGKVHRP